MHKKVYLRMKNEYFKSKSRHAREPVNFYFSPMEIMSLCGSLPFIYPFTISGGRSKTNQETLLIKIKHDGFIGIGEAPIIKYYQVNASEMLQEINEQKDFLEKNYTSNPRDFYPFLCQAFPTNSFLRCAIDIAMWDLYGKIKNQAIYSLLGYTWKTPIMTDYTIGLDLLETMILKLKNKAWPMYKIKLGEKNDIEIIEALRANTDKPFRVDANAAWTLPEAIEKINTLHTLGVILVEQPLEKGNYEEMKKLKEVSPIPLFADESCVSPSDVSLCESSFDGINIKLTKCGGITPAISMVNEAKVRGLQVMMGNMNDSSIGTAAIAQFLPVLDHIDADGPLLLHGDHATGLKIDNGNIYLSHEPGLGIIPLF
jgi:L-alanine-DL-glutamate epimerase-like enolase superfamily enzyme